MNEPLYLDVRTEAEYAERHLPCSLNIPVDTLAQRLEELGPQNRHIIVYCHAGTRGQRALEILRDAGFESVENVRSLDAARARREAR